MEHDSAKPKLMPETQDIIHIDYNICEYETLVYILPAQVAHKHLCLLNEKKKSCLDSFCI